MATFNTDAIVYDNTPWRPGQELDFGNKSIPEEDERRLKNLATRVLSNGVEVLVKDKSTDRKLDQRKNKLIPMPKKIINHQLSSSPMKSLLSSAVATFVNHQHMSAMFPLHQLMHQNYIIKTCLTTYTYLTTIIQNKRSEISTFETIVSVVTTESLSNPYASDLIADIYPTKTRYVDIQTGSPSLPNTKLYSSSSLAKINKRVDYESEGGTEENFDLIQPSEVSHTPCSTLCSCSNTETEGLDRLKTKYTDLKNKNGITTTVTFNKFHTKNTANKNVESVKLHLSDKNNFDQQSSTTLALTDKIVEKYTEVMNDYSDEKDPGIVEMTELLTNEQAPEKTDKVGNNKEPEKVSSGKPKPSKNKVVADLIKLGSLGIKGLTQLAPVLEKMTEGFIKRSDKNKTITTTTIKPITKITPYNVDKRVDSELDSKQNNFPIYIPVDELETAESQFLFNNITLNHNLAWFTEHKHPKIRIAPPKIVHESPLVNGGIPISPGEIITANSDVIVGKPAVSGPLTVASSGMKLKNLSFQNYDSHTSSSEQFLVKDNPVKPNFKFNKADDSYDLRPPELPKSKHKQPPNRNLMKPHFAPTKNQDITKNQPPSTDFLIPNKKARIPLSPFHHEQLFQSENSKITNTMIGNHGRPAFLDYIPSFQKPIENNEKYTNNKVGYKKEDGIIQDSHPSSSETMNTRIKTGSNYSSQTYKDPTSIPFLVDIQPSKVANVLIPHGSSTALVFAGSSEPHKTGDYVDDPLPYPEPGYFGSFSIDAPKMTNVHNVLPHNNKQVTGSITVGNDQESEIQAENNENNKKWRDSLHQITSKIPPPTSNQATHIQIGPKVTSYNPTIYSPSNSNFNKFNIRNPVNDDQNKIIDREYEKFLSVPPPPPNTFVNTDFQQDNNKSFNNRPIVHTKPIQDMKVFFNLQHPIPNSQSHSHPKVTSEIYFAAQSPTGDKKTPVYTVHIPSVPNKNNNEFNTHSIGLETSLPNKTTHFSIPKSPMLNRPLKTQNNLGNYAPIKNNNKNKENSYSVTLNAAANVANEAIDDTRPNVPLSQNVLTNYFEKEEALAAPKTNTAIKIDGAPILYQTTYNPREPQKQFVYSQQGEVIKSNQNNKITDNRWNVTAVSIHPSFSSEKNNYNLNEKEHRYELPHEELSSDQTFNSHANFPMISEMSTVEKIKNDDKFPENIVDESHVDQKRPAKLIPNIPTNSHEWYSSNPIPDLDFSNLKKINNVHVEATTRKAIPLLHQYNTNKIPDFGQKLQTAGRPPTEILSISNRPVMYHPGKPFSKSERPENNNNFVGNPSTFVTTKPYGFNYLPSNYVDIKQPVYDIPIIDNSHETTTLKSSDLAKGHVKPVIENSEEIYDSEGDNEGFVDGEISLESMKVPVISSSDDKSNKPNTSTELTLLQEEVLESIQQGSHSHKNDPILIPFNPGSQTEKPFPVNISDSGFQSNTIKPIIDNSHSHMKPRPFAVNTFTTVGYHSHQPHWQINELLKNFTNLSSEDNIDLNIGEEITVKTDKPILTNKKPYNSASDEKPKQTRPIFSVKPNNTLVKDETNIITSTVHIQEKTPITVLNKNDGNDASSISFTTENVKFSINRSSAEIIDLSPPPPTIELSFKTTSKDETIMGMSPPPPVRPSVSTSLKPPIFPPRQAFPQRTPSPYKPKPIRTLPPRISNTRPLPTRRPIVDNLEEMSTPKPYDMSFDNYDRFKYDQPSSQLLPPPTEIPSQFMSSVNNVNAHGTPPNTPLSSSWLTSSGVDFSSTVQFAPTSIHFPENFETTKISELSSETSLLEDEDFQYENNTSLTISTENSTLTSKEVKNVEQNGFSSQEEILTTTDRMKVIPLTNKPRIRKPYPIRSEVKKSPTNIKSSTNKYKVPTKPTSIIRPTRTVLRPNVLFPTKQTIVRNIHPIPTRRPIIQRPSIIESSESSIDDDYIKPTETLKESSILQSELTKVSKGVESTVQNYVSEIIPTINPIHHGGNEIKIYDEIVPTKTELKTTVITLTKTLSEPPKTISSIGYVNLTHTLTITHTKTSLISQSEGQVTQTLVLTNTQTSTVVDVVTEVQTQILPTTIIETVTKHIPILQLEPTQVIQTPTNTRIALDDVTMSSEEENFIIKDSGTTENIQKIEKEDENDTFFVVMNKSQNGGNSPPVNTAVDTSDYDGVTRNEQVNNNGVSQVLFGEILLAGTPYLETTNVNHAGFGKECQPDCKASRNERCQRIEGMMKCVCRPGFARMFPDRPCKPTYTYSVKLALSSHGKKRLIYRDDLGNNSSKEYSSLAHATHEGINRLIMQSDLRDVYHGVHITGFRPVQMSENDRNIYQGVMNDFYVQLSDNAHESRLKEVIEKYLRNNNYSLGGTDVYASGELIDKLDVSDFDECTSNQFNDCSEHAQCFNLRGTYTCSCSEGFADLSVNSLYPGRICSAEPVGCERCNYHGSCYSRDDNRVLCECFQWYAGSTCHINLKVVLISLVTCGALLTAILVACAVVACSKRPRRQRSIVTCIQSMPALHQGGVPSKLRADRRALITERADSGDGSSLQNASLPYTPAKKSSAISSNKKFITISDPPAHDPPPPPAPAVLIPRARLHQQHRDSRDNSSRKQSLEISSEAKLISYLEAGANSVNDEMMRRKHSEESSYSLSKERHSKQGALVSAGFKVSTTIRPDEQVNATKDDDSSIHKADIEAELSRFETLRKSYSNEDISEWTDAEQRIGELTLSEARSVGGTLPASTGRPASSTRLTNQEANTMAERDLGSTFLLPHVHLYKPDITSDVSEFDSL